MPWFIAPNGPIREARFVQSTVRPTAVCTTCSSSRAERCGRLQHDPAELPAGGNAVTGLGGNRNVVFRIPTPIFGGLIEAIPTPPFSPM
jgi:hypothetical protein